MKINETSGIKSNFSIKKKRVGGGGDFSAYLATGEASDSDGAGSASESAPVSMNALLSLQEIPEEDMERKRAVQRGHHQLAALEKLRHGLLMGIIPLSSLQELEQTIAKERQAVSDPALVQILDDIELRVAVELAKLDRSRR